MNTSSARPTHRTKTPETHGSDVRIINPLLEVERANRIDDNDGVLMNARHRFDKVVTVRPSGQVITVSDLQRQYGRHSIADLT